MFLPPDARRFSQLFSLDQQLANGGTALADWKPMTTVGKGVQEIRIRDDAGPFQVINIAKFSDTAYLLHRFQEKPQKANKS